MGRDVAGDRLLNLVVTCNQNYIHSILFTTETTNVFCAYYVRTTMISFQSFLVPFSLFICAHLAVSIMLIFPAIIRVNRVDKC